MRSVRKFLPGIAGALCLLSACVSRDFNNPNDPASSGYVPNHPVRFLTVPDTLNDTLLTGKPYILDILFDDPDGNPVSLTLAAAPAGCTLSNGKVAWTPGKWDTGAATLTLLASDGQGSFDTLHWTLTVRLSPRDWIVASDTGVIWLGGTSNDSLYIDLPVSTSPVPGFNLTAWGLMTSATETSLVRLDTLTRASDTQFTLSHKHLFSILGESGGKTFSSFLISLETGVSAASPAELLYNATPSPAFLRDLRWMLEKSPDTLASNQKSLADACHFDLQHAIEHAGFAAQSLYITHGKHLANILTGTNTIPPAYAAEGNPAGDINGPIVYFSRIRGYLTADIRPAFAGNDPLQRDFADSLIVLFDTLGFRVSRAHDWAVNMIGAADQTAATNLVNAEILPIIRPMRDSAYTAGAMPMCESGSVNFKTFFRRLYRAYLLPLP